MKKICRFLFFFFSFALYGQQQLEVRLPTQTPLTPIHLSELHIADDQIDWRYPEELRSLLAFDLTNNGTSSIILLREDWGKKLEWPDPRTHFDLAFWNQQHILFLITLHASNNTLFTLVFNIAKGTSKRYPEIILTGKAEFDRQAIHQMADAIQKDLFGIRGIASSRLLFSQRIKNPASSDPEWLSDIWISDWDGANAQRLTMAQGYCISPGFLSSQEGSYFYTCSEKGQSKIYRSSFRARKGVPWFQLRGNQLLPCLSRNGSQIAFISDVAGRPDLFILNLDSEGNAKGRPRQIFSASNATQASPTYSPDGRKLAFVSDKEGTPRIFVIEIRDPRETTRTQPKLLTRKNRENTSPAWSPDGTKLAYSARSEGVRQIWIYDFTTDQEWQLTSGENNKENPSWAPDSLHLVYNTETNDISELFVINLVQQVPLQITSGFGQKRFASWEPMR